MASSNVSEVQDCRKRSRQQQIQGSSWVLRGQITIDQLHANSDGMTAVPEGDVENEDRISKLNARLQGLLGAQFKILWISMMRGQQKLKFFPALLLPGHSGRILGDCPARFEFEIWSSEFRART